MQLPKRKPNPYSLIPKDHHVTREQIEKLSKELDRLKTKSRPQAITDVQQLAALGDFSENHAYQVAKGRLRGINARIDEIEDSLKYAIAIEPTASDTVQLGSEVTIKGPQGEKEYHIVGSQEADPRAGKLSHNSPVGRALIGHRAGDTVTVTINDAAATYTITKIK